MLLPFFRLFIYKSLTDYGFTVKRYIDLRLSGNPKYLNKTMFNVPKYVYIYTLADISNEYIELSKNEELIKEKAQRDNLQALTERHFLLRAIDILLKFDCLNDEESERLRALLRTAGIRNIDPKRIESELRALEVKINVEKSLIPTAEDKPSVDVSKSDFIKVLAFLNKEGFQVSLDSSVLYYIESMNLYREQRKQLEEQLEKTKSSNGRISS